MNSEASEDQHAPSQKQQGNTVAGSVAEGVVTELASGCVMKAFSLLVQILLLPIRFVYHIIEGIFS
jgi:hypothetical protein